MPKPKFHPIKRNLQDLIPYVNNARTHSDEQVNQIAASIKEFGFTNPVIIDEDDGIIAGHGRVMAAQKLKVKDVPCIQVEGWSDAQKKAYILADNKLALNAGWDDDLLKIELKDLEAMDFDLSLIGFDDSELKDLTFEEKEGLTDEDAVPDVPDEPVSIEGDVWILGEHRLMCGDSLDQANGLLLTGGEKIDMLFTDPPYGLGGYCGRGENTMRAVKNDELDPKQFYEALPPAPEMYVWGGFKNLFDVNFQPRDVIVWRKNNFGMGKGYRGQYEVCFYEGGFSGSDSDVWDVAKDNDYKHPTQKPVALIERAIKNSKPRNVLDLYGGSGSTLIGCEKMSVKCYMMELDPHYVDVIIKRWQDYTGKQATMAGDTYEAVAQARGIKLKEAA